MGELALSWQVGSSWCQTSELAFWQQNSQSRSQWLDVEEPQTSPRWLVSTSFRPFPCPAPLARSHRSGE